jgi:c-di-GMP-binding flagellar brake protein YcgR
VENSEKTAVCDLQVQRIPADTRVIEELCPIDSMPDSHRAALELLTRDYADISTRSRIGLRITPGESKDSYTVSTIGVIRAKRILVLTAPVTDDGALVAVHNGQTLTCRWFGTTTAFRFRAKILRTLFEPVPLLHVELPPSVERRTVRGVPRALANLRGAVKSPNEIEAVIVDISTSGARIAVRGDTLIRHGQDIVLHARPKMLNRQFDIIVRGQIVASFGNTDPKHPQIQFFGVEFGEISDQTLMILHAYVQECLAFETDTLGQLLMLTSTEVEDIE